MPPIQNRIGMCGFTLYQKRVLVVVLLLNFDWFHRDFWVHPYNAEVHMKGEFFTDYQDLRKYPHRFFGSYRMTVRQFDHLLHMVYPHIAKQDNNYRKTISAEERLVITLRYWFSS